MRAVFLLRETGRCNTYRLSNIDEGDMLKITVKGIAAVQIRIFLRRDDPIKMNWGDTMYCQNCGKQFEGNFCPNCGTPKSGVARDTSQTAQNDAQNRTQPLVKKWWFWTLIGITAIAVSVALLPNQQKNVWSRVNEVLEQSDSLVENDAAEAVQPKPGIAEKPIEPGPMTASGSGSDTSDALSIEETVLLDQDGVRVVATGISKDEWLGPEVSVLIENNAGKKVMVQVRDTSVNGAMVTPYFSCEVEAGKKANDAIAFDQASLDIAGIVNIQSIELKTIVLDPESWETVSEGETATIRTNVPEQTQVFDDSGYVALDQGGIKFILRDAGVTDTTWSKNIAFFIENRSGRDVSIQLRDVSVNGFMIDPIFSCDVLDGKVAYSSASFMTEDLVTNGIDEIESMAFSVLVMDMHSWNTIFQSKSIEATLS